MRFQLYQLQGCTAIGLKSGKKSINWVSVGHFKDLKVTLKLKLQISNFPQKLHVKLYPLQLEICQTSHFQVTGQNMQKM